MNEVEVLLTKERFEISPQRSWRLLCSTLLTNSVSALFRSVDGGCGVGAQAPLFWSGRWTRWWALFTILPLRIWFTGCVGRGKERVKLKLTLIDLIEKVSIEILKLTNSLKLTLIYRCACVFGVFSRCHFWVCVEYCEAGTLDLWFALPAVWE